MADINDLDKRLSVLEVEYANMEINVMKVETIVRENFEGTMSIKQRLDKWNGSIPHLVEDVQEVRKQQAQLLNLINKKNVVDAKQTMKLNIIWAIGAALAGSLLTLAIKLLVH